MSQHKSVNAAIEISEIDARLMHKNDRLEKHGDEDKLACDLEIAFDTSNDFLAHFSPTLKWSLYAKDEDVAKKKSEELFQDDGHLTGLRYPQIESMRWNGLDQVGATLTFHKAVSGPQGNVVFEQVQINKWRIEAKQGGSITIRFRAQIIPEKKHRGELMDMLEHGNVVISLVPPSAEPAGEQVPIDGTGDFE